jgi:hypothetical protein
MALFTTFTWIVSVEAIPAGASQDDEVYVVCANVGTVAHIKPVTNARAAFLFIMRR